MPMLCTKNYHSFSARMTLLAFLLQFLGCMLILAACFTHAHCAYVLLLSMLDCERMHHAVK